MIPELNQRIGKIIRARRVLAGLSQEAVAKQLGITFQQVQKYEKGSNALSLVRFLQIAPALSCSAVDLIAEIEGKPGADSPISSRAELEMMKRLRVLTPVERNGINAMLKVLAVGKVA